MWEQRESQLRSVLISRNIILDSRRNQTETKWAWPSWRPLDHIIRQSSEQNDAHRSACIKTAAIFFIAGFLRKLPRHVSDPLSNDWMAERFVVCRNFQIFMIVEEHKKSLECNALRLRQIIATNKKNKPEALKPWFFLCTRSDLRS